MDLSIVRGRPRTKGELLILVFEVINLSRPLEPTRFLGHPLLRVASRACSGAESREVGLLHAEQHDCGGRVPCSLLAFLPHCVDTPPRPTRMHTQVLQPSGVFRPMVVNLSCTLELLGELCKMQTLGPAAEESDVLGLGCT